jgi:hypothetical protein
VVKVVMIAGATIALVTAAGTAGLPHPQPVYPEAPIGKAPALVPGC